MRSDYPSDFGKYVIALCKNPNADPVDLYSCLKQLSSIGEYINENKFNEDDVNKICENYDITKDVVMSILDAFLCHVSKNIK